MDTTDHKCLNTTIIVDLTCSYDSCLHKHTELNIINISIVSHYYFIENILT